jgi:hypothetical protein
MGRIFTEIMENYAPVTFAHYGDMTRTEIPEAKGERIYVSSNLSAQKR